MLRASTPPLLSGECSRALARTATTIIIIITLILVKPNQNTSLLPKEIPTTNGTAWSCIKVHGIMQRSLLYLASGASGMKTIRRCEIVYQVHHNISTVSRALHQKPRQAGCGLIVDPRIGVRTTTTTTKNTHGRVTSSRHKRHTTLV